MSKYVWEFYWIVAGFVLGVIFTTIILGYS